MPPLRVGDQKVTKDLHAGDAFHLFGINKVAIQFGHIGLRQQPDQAFRGLDQIIRQHRDADAAFRRMAQNLAMLFSPLL